MHAAKGTIAPLIGGMLGLFSACGESEAPVVSETRELMGTVVSIRVLDSGLSQVSTAIESAYRAMESVDESMSTYREDSEISRLNRDGWVEAGPDFLAVLDEALAVHRESGGAFDPTMKPLLELHERSFADRDGPPSAAELRPVLELVDASRIELDGTRITLPPGARLTLDAIAKGYAIDRAIEALRAAGIEHALVDAGGDVRAIGTKVGAPWQVALQNPRDPADWLTVISLADEAVATSGDYRRYFDPEMAYHHILDPRTGEPAEALISVSVRAPTATLADALATAVFVLGPDAGFAFAESREDVEALLVTDDRQVLTTSGW
jgi:thiamine biosynthesis lipoprotein